MATAAPTRGTDFHLRPSIVGDEPFLLELYAQSRAQELACSGMDALQREVFVQMQFRMRQAAYSTTYPTALDEIICGDDEASLGRVLTARAEDEMRLIDIAIAAEKQGQGIGTKVIQELQQECLTQGWKMRLQVLKGSSAEALYQWLGFRLRGEILLRRQRVWDGMKI
jgi:GNAT superfamily N-acetyltransferase